MADFKDFGTTPSANDLLTMVVIAGKRTASCCLTSQGNGSRRLEGHGDLAIISLTSALDTLVKVCHDNLSCEYCKLGKSDSVALDDILVLIVSILDMK